MEAECRVRGGGGRVLDDDDGGDDDDGRESKIPTIKRNESQWCGLEKEAGESALQAHGAKWRGRVLLNSGPTSVLYSGESRLCRPH